MGRYPNQGPVQIVGWYYRPSVRRSKPLEVHRDREYIHIQIHRRRPVARQGRTYRITTMKTYLWYARLGNGHAVECTTNNGGCGLSLGDAVQTQWGVRKVVEVFCDWFDTQPTEPYGC